MERDGIFNNYPNRQSHWIHPNVVQSVADCYRFQEGYFNLRGGSSGSMILNSDKEVVGIYWGTVTYLDSGKVYGTADILKSAQYDVINCANNDTQLS
jgi:V8-like Glu-specific endopeptidase